MLFINLVCFDLHMFFLFGSYYYFVFPMEYHFIEGKNTISDKQT